MLEFPVPAAIDYTIEDFIIHTGTTVNGVDIPEEACCTRKRAKSTPMHVHEPTKILLARATGSLWCRGCGQQHSARPLANLPNSPPPGIDGIASALSTEHNRRVSERGEQRPPERISRPHTIIEEQVTQRTTQRTSHISPPSLPQTNVEKTQNEYNKDRY